eukprot:scaffold731_cov261-Pinguiococcus_pyrenoidosus.AAC.92
MHREALELVLHPGHRQLTKRRPFAALVQGVRESGGRRKPQLQLRGDNRFVRLSSQHGALGTQLHGVAVPALEPRDGRQKAETQKICLNVHPGRHPPLSMQSWYASVAVLQFSLQRAKGEEGGLPGVVMGAKQHFQLSLQEAGLRKRHLRPRLPERHRRRLVSEQQASRRLHENHGAQVPDLARHDRREVLEASTAHLLQRGLVPWMLRRQVVPKRRPPVEAQAQLGGGVVIFVAAADAGQERHGLGNSTDASQGDAFVRLGQNGDVVVGRPRRGEILQQSPDAQAARLVAMGDEAAADGQEALLQSAERDAGGVRGQGPLSKLFRKGEVRERMVLEWNAQVVREECRHQSARQHRALELPFHAVVGPQRKELSQQLQGQEDPLPTQPGEHAGGSASLSNGVAPVLKDVRRVKERLQGFHVFAPGLLVSLDAVVEVRDVLQTRA